MNPRAGWDRVVAYLRAGTDTTPEAVRTRFIRLWRQVVLDSNRVSGCVVAGVALDSGAEETGLMEGALILCRADGSVQPLDDIAAELIRLLPPAKSR